MPRWSEQDTGAERQSHHLKAPTCPPKRPDSLWQLGQKPPDLTQHGLAGRVDVLAGRFHSMGHSLGTLRVWQRAKH